MNGQNFDILHMAGGSQACYVEAFASCKPDTKKKQSIEAVADTVFGRAKEGFLAVASVQVIMARDMFVLMHGDRPRAPSDAADAWDEQFESAILASCIPLFAPLLTQKNVLDTAVGVVDTPAAVEYTVNKLVNEYMSHIQTQVIPQRQHGPWLKSLGITWPDIERAWKNYWDNPRTHAHVSEAASYVAPTPELSSSAGRDVTANATLHEVAVSVAQQIPLDLDPSGFAGLTGQTTQLGAQELPLAPTTPHQPEETASKPHKRRTKSDKDEIVLPGYLFQSLREMGFPDKTMAEHAGVSASHYGRLATGKTPEAVVERVVAARFLAEVRRLQNELLKISTHAMLNFGV
jgi:hypothetical protein